MTIRTTSGMTCACPVTVDDAACGCDKLTEFFNGDAAQQVTAQRCLDQAWEILYGLSGRQYGLCEIKVRPCRKTCCSPCDFTGPLWTPVLRGGRWTNVRCGSCGDACSCVEVCELWLPGPIDSISEVKLDGSVLDPASYRVDNRNSLVRTTGGCWPTCQNMNLDTDQDNTWEITYLKGKELCEAGRAALLALACEICKACTNDKSCCLPTRTKSIVREGMSMELLDPMDFLDKGRTGVYIVDLWLRTINPLGRTRNAGIFSPDMPGKGYRTTTWPA